MHEHGFYDPDLKKWYCSYFMDEEEWMKIHDYLPSQVQEHLSNSESSGRKLKNISNLDGDFF